MRKILFGVLLCALLVLIAASARANGNGANIYPGKCLMRVTVVTARGLPDECHAANGFSFCRKRAEQGVWEVATPLWCQE